MRVCECAATRASRIAFDICLTQEPLAAGDALTSRNFTPLFALCLSSRPGSGLLCLGDSARLAVIKAYANLERIFTRSAVCDLLLVNCLQIELAAPAASGHVENEF